MKQIKQIFFGRRESDFKQKNKKKPNTRGPISHTANNHTGGTKKTNKNKH